MSRMPRALVGFEQSGVVRRALSKKGFDAWSCDKEPAMDGSNQHIVGDVRDQLDKGWDLILIMHPPCTRLCNSGARWLREPPASAPEGVTEQERKDWRYLSDEMRKTIMWRLLDEAAELFSDCWNAPCEHLAIENPVMHAHAREKIRNYQEYDQKIQPWQFGHPLYKGTCLYLRGLPKLQPTDVLVRPDRGTEEDRAWRKLQNLSDSKDRGIQRSITMEGIAEAMADQWGDFIFKKLALKETTNA